MQISAVGKDNTNGRDNLDDVLSVRLNKTEKKNWRKCGNNLR